MDAVRMVLVLLLAVVVSRVLARLSPIELPLPLLQIGIGAALSFVIGFNVRLDLDVFLLLFIAPLLFLDGWRIPKGAFFSNWTPHSHTRDRARRLPGGRSRAIHRQDDTCDTARRRLCGRGDPLADYSGVGGTGVAVIWGVVGRAAPV
jgi:Sodium/hydrogen exchanger family